MIPDSGARHALLTNLDEWISRQRQWTVRNSLTVALSPTTQFAVPHLWRAARHANAPTAVISAGIHGDEPSGPFALWQTLLDDELPDCVNWSVFPILNPHGFIHDSRTDASDRDINRDFKRCRTAVACFFISEMNGIPPPVLHLSLHEDWEYQQPYLYEINSGTAASIAGPLLQVLESHGGRLDLTEIDGHVPTAPGYIFHANEPDLPNGWPEAIFVVKRFATRSYTIEAPGKAAFAERLALLRACLSRISELARTPEFTG